MKRTTPGYGKFVFSWRGAGGYADRLSHSFRGVKRLRLQDCRERHMGRSAGGMSRVVPLADFALIRHWRATFPTRGKASFDRAKSFMFCFLTDCKIGAESNDYELPKAAFPFEGEGGAKRRMRAGGHR